MKVNFCDALISIYLIPLSRIDKIKLNSFQTLSEIQRNRPFVHHADSRLSNDEGSLRSIDNLQWR